MMGITKEQFGDLHNSHSHFYTWCDAKGYGQTDPEGKSRGSSQIWFKEYQNDPTGNAARPPYCNFWHVALGTVVPGEMHNDSIVTMHALEEYPEDKEEYIENFGEWTIPFFDAYNELMEKLDPKCKGIKVEFSW